MFRLIVPLFFLSLVPGMGHLSAEPARLALVVGNAAYDGDAALKNPVNDATDVAAALKKAGWTVTLVTNADRRTFTRAIGTFRDSLATQEGADSLFYYAGHGMQIEGANYLIPVKVTFDVLDDVKADAVNLQTVTEAVQQAKAGVSLVILDACRDNPFAKKMSRSLGGTRGLTVVQSAGGASGSAILFSTSPGDVALDGDGRNGVFTSALLRHIDSDLKIEDLFKKINVDVQKATNKAQNPWLNASLSADFYLQSAPILAERAAQAAANAKAARQAELAQAVEETRAAHAAKVAAAEKEAEAAREAAAAAVAQLEASQNRPQGKLRVESSEVGKVFVGTEYLGEVGPDTPLVADTLALGRVDVKFVSPTSNTQKSVTVTDKVFATVVFGRGVLPTTIKYGVLSFKEIPDGWKITVNGELLGTTPLGDSRIPVGPAEVGFEFPSRGRVSLTCVVPENVAVPVKWNQLWTHPDQPWVLDKRTIDLGFFSKDDQWADITPLWSFPENWTTTALSTSTEFLIKKVYLCNDNKALYWRVEFFGRNPLKVLPTTVAQILKFSLNFSLAPNQTIRANINLERGQSTHGSWLQQVGELGKLPQSQIDFLVRETSLQGRVELSKVPQILQGTTKTDVRLEIQPKGGIDQQTPPGYIQLAR